MITLSMVAITLALVLFAQLFEPLRIARNLSRQDWLARAWANDRMVFNTPGVTHLLNHLIITPPPTGPAARHAFTVTYPTPAGEFIDEPIGRDGASAILTEEFWIDTDMKRFLRIIKEGVTPIFAVACDRQRLQVYNPRRCAEVQTITIPPRGIWPEDPAGIFGMTAGLPGRILAESTPNLAYRCEEKLYPAGVARVYQFTTSRNEAGSENGWRLKISSDGQRLIELERIENSQTVYTNTRIRTEGNARPPAHWDLWEVIQPNEEEFGGQEEVSAQAQRADLP